MNSGASRLWCERGVLCKMELNGSSCSLACFTSCTQTVAAGVVVVLAASWRRFHSLKIALVLDTGPSSCVYFLAPAPGTSDQ